MNHEYTVSFFVPSPEAADFENIFSSFFTLFQTNEFIVEF